MFCSACRCEIDRVALALRACPQCGAALPAVRTRREFLIQAGLVGGALLSMPTLLAACATSTVRAPTPTATPNAFDTKWQLVNEYGIQMDDQGAVWNAGHVNDALELSAATGIVVASHSSGVWMLTSDGSAIAMSRDWESPDIACLAHGPDGVDHIYAGGLSHSGIELGESFAFVPGVESASDLGVLYMTDTSAPAPLLAPWKTIATPGIGVIRRIIVLTVGALIAQVDRIVLATSNGIYWSNIPQKGSADTYTWKQATGLPVPAGDFYDLALGPNGSLATSAWPRSDAETRSGHYGIFRGQWNAVGDLEFSRSAVSFDGGIPYLTITFLRAISLASCAGDLRVMYAAGAISDGRFADVFRSDDGGATWTQLPARTSNLGGLTGDQGNGWNNGIGVSATDPNTVAFGWVGGPFLSKDGGQTFANLSSLPGRHDDFHAIRFVQSADGSSERMYVCSDGGVVVSNDGGASFSSAFNQKLANLEFLGPTAVREWPGCMGSDTVNGLMGGGLQDNGEVWGPLEPSTQPWRRISAGDGRFFVYLANSKAVHYTNGNSTRSAHWDGSTLRDDGVIRVRTPAPGQKVADDGGLYMNVYLAEAPTYANSGGERLYAFGAADHDIYGLFDDGTTLRWDHLTTIPETNGDSAKQGIASIGSYSGGLFLVGLSVAGGKGSMMYFFRTSAPIWPGQVLPAPGGTAPYVPKIVVLNDDVSAGSLEAYALIDDSGNGRLYYTADGVTWTRADTGLPGSMYFTLDVDRSTSPARVFVANDNAVFGSKDKGVTWSNVSNGLPRQPRCSDLRVAQPGGNGPIYLYLATFGWSVWRTTLK